MDAEEWTQLGIEHRENGEYQKAHRAFEKALKIDPEYIPAWGEKGNILRALDYPEKALDAYKQVLNLSRGLAAAWHGMGNALCDLGRQEAALQAHEEALHRNPELAAPWHGKGNALHDLGRQEEALRAYEEAVHLDPELAPAWSGKGNALRDLDRLKEALRAYEEALGLDPEYANAWTGKGNVLSDLGRPEEALDAYEQALDLNPEYAPGWNGMGNTLIDLGRLEEALQAFEEALDLDPELAAAWHGKGNALRDLGRQEEALRAYEEAVHLDPELAPAWNGKGNALRDLGRLEEALRAYEEALGLDPDCANAWDGKGIVLRDLGHSEEALQAFEEALDLDPEHANAWINRGRLLRSELNRPAAAHRSILRVLHLVDHASDLRIRRLATKKLPSVLEYFQDTGSAPLLIVSIVERYGLTDVYVQKPRPVSRAYEQVAPYRLLRRHFSSSPETNPEKRRRHSLLGLAAFYLGDPFLAQEHFSEVEELSDLFGPFYYGRTYQEYAKVEDADLIFEVAREEAERILQRGDRPEKVGSKKFYYAGQLFIAGSTQQWQKACRCFELSADRGFLPAKYMFALSLGELGEEQTDVHEEVVVSILEEEKMRLEEQGERTYKAGFLGGARLSDLPRSLEGGDGDKAGLIEDLERSLWRFSHAAEISNATLHIYEWIETQKKERGQVPSEYAFVNLYDQPETQHSWILREQQIEALQKHLIEEKEGVDLERLRTSLDRYPNIPSEWIGGDASQIDPRRQEELLGERISRDTGEERSTRYQELITYLALKGRISARATLSLNAYLLATEPASTAEIREKITESTVEAAITTGGTELLKLAGMALGPFTSFSTTVAASLTAAFITDFVKEWRDQRLDYPTFREKFDTKLEGQSEEVYEQVMTMLEEIKERQP